MLIRKLTLADAPAFRQLRFEMCDLHPEAFGQTPAEVMALPDATFTEWILPHDSYPEKFVLSAWDNSQLVGTVAFRREDSIKERHRGYIWSVYLKEPYRGQGISRTLMQQLIDEARHMDGLELLILSVATTQIAAQALYRSPGFRVFSNNYHGYKLPDGRYVDHEEMLLEL